MTYAHVQDVADELGVPEIAAGPLTSQINGWLRMVEAMIRARIPNVDDLVIAGALSADLIRGVEAAAVARKSRNPEGLRSVTQALDDGSVTRVRDAQSSDGVLRITDDEWDLLLPEQASDALSVRYSFTPGWRECADPGLGPGWL